MVLRLTHERVNGIKEGYWSSAKKDELTQSLGAYEDTGLTPQEIKELKKKGDAISPAERHDPYDVCNDFVEIVCPSCLCWFTSKTNNGCYVSGGKPNYCPNCGQKIKWKEA